MKKSRRVTWRLMQSCLESEVYIKHQIWNLRVKSWINKALKNLEITFKKDTMSYKKNLAKSRVKTKLSKEIFTRKQNFFKTFKKNKENLFQNKHQRFTKFESSNKLKFTNVSFSTKIWELSAPIDTIMCSNCSKKSKNTRSILLNCKAFKEISKKMWLKTKKKSKTSPKR